MSKRFTVSDVISWRRHYRNQFRQRMRAAGRSKKDQVELSFGADSGGPGIEDDEKRTIDMLGRIRDHVISSIDLIKKHGARKAEP